MKLKTIKNLNVLVFLLTLGFLSCKENTKQNKTEEANQESQTAKIKRPRQTIDYKYANELEEEYVNTRYAVINEHLKIEKGDTREFWFDLEKLKNYIAYVEQEAEELGYRKLGIRIYNGAYPKDPKGRTNTDPGYSTVFLVPTGMKSISKGSFLPLNTTLVNDNIMEIPGYNYSHGGKPPKKLN